MDSLIEKFDAVVDADLTLCLHRGIAYQTDMRDRRIAYDADYMEKCRAYDNSDVAHRVIAGRLELVHRYHNGALLDVGIGSGAFLRAAGECARGYDVNHDAIDWLKRNYAYDDNFDSFNAFTFWDVLEHVEDPTIYLQRIPQGAHLFASLPIFPELCRIRASKHYRPGEHLYYFTSEGFVGFMELYGFRLLEKSSHEITAGRESIGAFAFKRDLPDYHGHVAAYKQIHSTRYYGSSAVELHLAAVAGMIKLYQPVSILDFGCGRSDLASHFWLDGARRIGRYDPAIPEFKRMPEGQFELGLCCDVLEHVPMASLGRVLSELRGKTDAALFTISTKPSRAKLPDGRNAHVTLLRPSEWIRWIEYYFGEGEVVPLPTKWEHELMLAAGAAAPAALKIKEAA